MKRGAMKDLTEQMNMEERLLKAFRAGEQVADMAKAEKLTKKEVRYFLLKRGVRSDELARAQSATTRPGRTLTNALGRQPTLLDMEVIRLAERGKKADSICAMLPSRGFENPPDLKEIKRIIAAAGSVERHSTREQVLRAALDGATNQQIAKDLDVSLQYVTTMVGALRRGG